MSKKGELLKVNRLATRPVYQQDITSEKTADITHARSRIIATRN
jgi:hypothetical protein